MLTKIAALFFTGYASDQLELLQVTDKTTLEWEEVAFGPAKIWLACKYNLPGRFEYVARFDNGCYPRVNRFTLDEDRRCQQSSTRSYPHTCISPICGENCEGACATKCAELPLGSTWNSYGIRFSDFKANCVDFVSYDRGHLVPANHLDHNKTLIAMSNIMVNISPQAAQMNRGAWLYTEELTECWRDIEPLHIVGGSVWNDENNEPGMEGRNTWFNQSHGVQPAVYFWKIIKAKATGIIASQLGIHHIAFWVPNTEDASRKNINAYVVTLAKLEENLRRYDQPMTFEESKKDVCYGECYRNDACHGECSVWPMPAKCDLS